MMRDRLLGLLAGAVVLAAGCSATGSDVAPENPASEAHRAMLAAVAAEVILPTQQAFHEAAAALVVAAEAYAVSLGPEERQAAQERWREAMALWQRVEVFQVGPAGAMTHTTGGQDLRDEIYSWPTVNPCRVDQELVEQAYADVDAFAADPTNLINVRGLDALEYLLFADDNDNACKSGSAINRDGTWEPLVTSGELEGRRAAYASTVATLLARDAETLLVLWETPETGFLAELAGAGTTSTVFGTAQEGLNAVSDALFYLDKLTKDTKLAVPAGISGCNQPATCPDALESRFASASKEHVIANIEGFQALFHGAGADGIGFDDLLAGVGNEALTAELSAALTAALEAVHAVDGSFTDALAEAPDALHGAYEALKKVTDLLKTEFVSTLDLELPARAAGDND